MLAGLAQHVMDRSGIVLTLAGISPGLNGEAW